MFDEDFFGPAFGWAGGRPERPHGPHRPHREGEGKQRPGFENQWGRGPQFEGPWSQEPGFGPGAEGPWGPRFRSFWGLFGPGGRRGPNRFGRGDLKYMLLELLQEQPKHGYEMIKDLEGRAGGFYTPSAGAVYPTLQLMEDRGWVTSETVEGKKVYTITDAGRQALAERGEQDRPAPGHGPGPGGPGGHHGPRGPFGPHMSPELGALGRESLEVARLMRDAVMASNGDPSRLAQLRAIMEQTQTALRAFLQQGGGGSSTPPSQAPPETV